MTDLTKWTDEDLQYEICNRLADFIQEAWAWEADHLEKNKLLRKEDLIYFAEFTNEFRRRHPIRELYDEEGNWIGGN